MTSPPLVDLKEKLRRQALSRRDGVPETFRSGASHHIGQNVLGIPELRKAGLIGSYWAIRSEVDTRPLMEALIARGQEIALSQIRHPHLSFRLWRPGDALVKGGFGVQEPGPDAPEVFPAALLVPLVAFDRHGGRIGYGKGHFDRAIATLEKHHPVVTVGLAFAVQEVEQVPLEPHDRLLDIVVTETELIRAKPQHRA